MEFRLVGGDYLPDGRGGFVTVSGAEEVLQRALLRLSVRKGAIPFWPQYGSRLHELSQLKPSVRKSEAAGFVSEALLAEPDIQVEDVRVLEDESGRMRVTVWLTAGVQSAQIVWQEGMK